MEKLPHEMLAEVFQYILQRSRISCSLVCRRWAKVLCTPGLLDDIRLVLLKADLNKVTTVLLDSDRRYINLSIAAGTLLDSNADFWSRICGHLRDLEIEDCEVSPVDFYSILQKCQKLESLSLKGNTNLAWISEGPIQLPKSVSVAQVQESLRNVRHLSLRMNASVTSSQLEQILRLTPNLTSLCLAWCENLQLRASGLLKSTQKFIALDLRGTDIDKGFLIQIVEQFGESLLELQLCHAEYRTSETYEPIRQCTKLRILGIEWLKRRNSLPKRILSETLELRHLNFKYSFGLRDMGLSDILRLRELQYINLKFCLSLSTNMLCKLGQMSELQYLNLSGTQCDIMVLRELSSLKHIRVLKFNSCIKLDTECFALICDKFKKLEKLGLKACKGLTDEAGLKFHQMRQLQKLNVTRVKNITDQFFENGVGSSGLKVLHMGNRSLTDAALVSIATHHVDLEFLHLRKCDQITDVGFEFVVQRLRRLRFLSLVSCSSLTDRSLEALCQGCPHLRSVSIKLCSFSDDGVSMLAHHRPMVSLWNE